MIKLDLWDIINARRPKDREIRSTLALESKIDQMNPETKIAIHHLIWIWYQYGGGSEQEGKIVLPHKSMGAGEQATDFLCDLGLGVDTGYQFELNAAGMEIFNAEPEEMIDADEPAKEQGEGKDAPSDTPKCRD